MQKSKFCLIPREFCASQKHNSCEAGSLECRKERAMRIPVLIFSAASVMALSGLTKADDHLLNAEDHGLNGNTHAQATLKSDAPGQGSPFFGNDTQTPSSATVTGDPDEGIPAKPHANIKD